MGVNRVKFCASTPSLALPLQGGGDGFPMDYLSSIINDDIAFYLMSIVLNERQQQQV